MFSVQFVSKNTLLATLPLSSAVSFYLGRSQNDIIGNGTNPPPPPTTTTTTIQPRVLTIQMKTTFENIEVKRENAGNPYQNEFQFFSQI